MDSTSCDVDFSLRQNKGNGIKPRFSSSQRQIYEFLLQRSGKMVTRDELNTLLYGERRPKHDTLHVFVEQIRKKLGPDAIYTIRNVGYMLILK